MPDKGASLADRLRDGVVLVAEGYVFEMERRCCLKAGPFVPEVVLEDPDALRQLHREFTRAGSDVMVACTYYAHRAKLKTVGKEDVLEKMNRAAIQIAKDAASETGALTAGNICNTWAYKPDDAEAARACRAIFEEQVAWAADEGVDLVIAETFSSVGEAMLALEVIGAAGLPSVVTYIATQDVTCDGHSWGDACKKLEDAGADVVGLNCGRGPQTIMPIVEDIRAAVQGHVAAVPVPYRTTPEQPFFQSLKRDGKRAFPLDLDPFLLDRQETAAFAVEARDAGAKYLGLCCGAGPHHIRAMAEALGRTVPASRYSPDLSLHPAFGKEHADRDRNVECIFGPTEDE